MSKETPAETSRERDTSARHAPEQAEETCCPIIELRQYLHHPGRRDAFIALFDDYFIEEQERYGAFIPGQFRDRTNPDRFVWLRGFADMQTRRTALHDFYQVSPLWQAYRTAANDTISDVSNVFLLRPARVSTGFCFDPANRPMRDAEDLVGGVIIATIYAFDAPVDPRFVDFFENSMIPLLRSAGATLLGHFVTESTENTYPALPVRAGENVFVWFASFADEAASSSYHAALTHHREWITFIVPALHMWGAELEETLELLPTRRSLLRHHAQEQATRKDVRA
ncbi:MAG: NIPSNAP family protein [Ktedonobacteraceae bacterium]|nr:NIPSNAP family protein [Ktedonobacteraceae bacterium]